ncbi:molecular chaperone [Enterorhabdus sp. P55]|uniref:TorD/DmsD family molecular chaperone n=1 Tax=Enterorhabdus sp. P55 TaxID=2304571 RepID=UPI00136F15AC|nr:molecular chaperone TorD family protein [Enterorhabdus sp. P55]MCI8450988.1 molecular chaperone TorD family protein [Eggerthellaceae bacterium]NBI32345.1 molecular chaperone TorD [Enterorhabdus sp. P55]
MTVTADTWQARAALCELLALSFRYPDDVLVGAIASGEWGEAAEEIAGALGLAWPADGAPGAAEAAAVDDPDELKHALRAEATRLFVGAPEPLCSPYEGVWRAADDGVQALLFVNPHSMDVERFCKACGLGRPEGTNEPLDHVATEFELLEYLALRAAVDAAAEAGDPVEDADEGEPGDVVASADLPGGSPAAAYDQFMDEHVRTWTPRFADKAAEDARLGFYPQAGSLLKAFVAA